MQRSLKIRLEYKSLKKPLQTKGIDAAFLTGDRGRRHVLRNETGLEAGKGHGTRFP